LHGIWIAYIHDSKTISMKTFGIILIVAGIAMILFRGFSVQTEKKVVDVGPVEINKKENKWIGWPTYAGALIAIVGVVMVVADKKKA
jgi:drug/metabolite transporter (DMT)-like permease